MYIMIVFFLIANFYTKYAIDMSKGTQMAQNSIDSGIGVARGSISCICEAEF